MRPRTPPPSFSPLLTFTSNAANCLCKSLLTAHQDMPDDLSFTPSPCLDHKSLRRKALCGLIRISVLKQHRPIQQRNPQSR